jgi:23S rRNA pseudouridine955/2504/2580 synthase
MHERTISVAEEGQRLDRLLRRLLPQVPLGAIFRHLRGGTIRVDGAKAKPSLRLRAGMQLSLSLPASDLAAILAADERAASAMGAATATSQAMGRRAPRIVHQDDDLLVVVKPAGLAAQPGSGQDDDLTGWLAAQPFVRRTATFAPAPAHRLDRGTSGFVAIGLSPHGLRGLTAAFRDGRVAKTYLAVVEGVPTATEGRIEAPLWTRTSARAHQPKVLVDVRGKPARTDWQVLERGPRRCLLRLVLHTGRTHQIRAHLGHLGHPIVGDRRYGSRSELEHGGFLLHAAELAFAHPVTDERLSFHEPAPAHFAELTRS